MHIPEIGTARLVGPLSHRCLYVEHRSFNAGLAWPLMWLPFWPQPKMPERKPHQLLCQAFIEAAVLGVEDGDASVRGSLGSVTHRAMLESCDFGMLCASSHVMHHKRGSI